MMSSHLMVLILGYGLYGTTSALRVSKQFQLESEQECGMEDYASGKWAPITKMQKSFVCCDWQGGPGSGGSESCTNGAQVIPSPHNHQALHGAYSGAGAPGKYITGGGKSCGCDTEKSTLDRVLDMEKYEWQPSSCQLKAFDANNFCSMLNHHGGNLVVVGDSTAEQAGSTLMNMIRAGSSNGQGCSHKVQVRLTDTFNMGDNERQKHQRWFDQNGLNNTDLEKTSVQDDMVSEVSSMIADTIQSASSKDILLLSSGPHWHNKEKYQHFLSRIAGIIRGRKNTPNPPVILWKTISGAGCGPKGVVTGDSYLEGQKSREFSWNLFPSYDAMAKTVMTSISVPVVDVSMLYQRGDAHPGTFTKQGDCLHFCTPGPLDVIAPILEHVLHKVL